MSYLTTQPLVLELPNEMEMEEEINFQVRPIHNHRQEMEDKQMRKTFFSFMNFLNHTDVDTDISALIRDMHTTINTLHRRQVR